MPWHGGGPPSFLQGVWGRSCSSPPAGELGCGRLASSKSTSYSVYCVYFCSLHKLRAVSHPGTVIGVHAKNSEDTSMQNSVYTSHSTQRPPKYLMVYCIKSF